MYDLLRSLKYFSYQLTDGLSPMNTRYARTWEISSESKRIHHYLNILGLDRNSQYTNTHTRRQEPEVLQPMKHKYRCGIRIWRYEKLLYARYPANPYISGGQQSTLYLQGEKKKKKGRERHAAGEEIRNNPFNECNRKLYTSFLIIQYPAQWTN